MSSKALGCRCRYDRRVELILSGKKWRKFGMPILSIPRVQGICAVPVDLTGGGRLYFECIGTVTGDAATIGNAPIAGRAIHHHRRRRQRTEIATRRSNW